MTRFRVIVQPPAMEDMRRAYLWVAERNELAAARWLRGLEAAMQSLSRSPGRCPPAPETEFFQQEIRQLIYGRRTGRYTILFTVAAGAVHILHVRHGARMPLGSEHSGAN